ncbi:DNA replication complex GINS family protein [Candidatus Bathyarchaeota archaeon]|nr:DNA replication complex GINS family protein [Candidatus Bathyarchaeota archaeon]
MLSESGLRSLIEHSDFMFENNFVNVVAIINHPKIELVGLSIGPFEEGKDYTIRLWIARELEADGIVKIKEGALDATKLYRIQWTERIQAVSQLSSLPEDFYPKLRRMIEDLRSASKTSPEKMREYEYVQNLSLDIINCRLKKIISLASSLTQESLTLKNLTLEERDLYERIRRIINEWRSKIF